VNNLVQIIGASIIVGSIFIDVNSVAGPVYLLGLVVFVAGFFMPATKSKKKR
jgi:hypothetical protein